MLLGSRNTLGFVANISVLVVGIILAATVEDGAWQYRIFAIILVCVGFFTSLFYIITLREAHLVSEAKRLQNEYKLHQSDKYQAEKLHKQSTKSVLRREVKQWYQWFTKGPFYVYCLVFVLVRSAISIIGSIFSFYLVNVLMIKQDPKSPTPIPIALTPLISYAVSLAFHLFLFGRLAGALKNRYMPMLVGIAIITAGSIPMLFL